jgi:O-antigen/teichoic acid export membrane protein
VAGKFIKDLISVFNSRAAVILFGLGTSIVQARFLGPDGNGVIAALLVYPSLFMSIGSLGIRQSTTYFVGQNKNTVEEIYGAALSIWLLTSAISFAVCFFLIQFVTKDNFPLPQVLLVLIAIPFSLYNTYSSGIFLGKQNIKEFNRINWLPAFINCLFTFLLVGPIPLGVTGSLIGSFLSVFIMAFVVFNKMRKQMTFRITFNWTLINGMLRLGLVYAASLLIINLNYKVDIILLERLSTKSELGIYSKGVSIIQYLWEVPMLLSTLIFSRSAGAKDPKLFSQQVCRLLRFAGVIILVASIVLFFISPIIIRVMYGARFEGSIMVLKLLMPGILLLTIFKVLNMDMAGKGKPWLSMQAMIPAVVLNIVLNIFWIPKYGANGSAMASTVSYTLAALIFLFIYSNRSGIPVRDILRFTHEDQLFIRNLLTRFRPKSVVAK